MRVARCSCCLQGRAAPARAEDCAQTNEHARTARPPNTTHWLLAAGETGTAEAAPRIQPRVQASLPKRAAAAPGRAGCGRASSNCCGAITAASSSSRAGRHLHLLSSSSESCIWRDGGQHTVILAARQRQRAACVLRCAAACALDAADSAARTPLPSAQPQRLWPRRAPAGGACCCACFVAARHASRVT
jgi:hypothetical protein